LTYAFGMHTRPVTVAETSLFAKAADTIWSEAERTELIDYVAHNPDAGDVIPGTGGVRKLRWGKVGSGKRGGTRIVYFYYDEKCPLYLLLAYAKAQATDMTADEKKAVSAFASAIKGAK
jgi:hypothetical protein